MLEETDDGSYIKDGKIWTKDGKLIRVLDDQDYEYDSLAGYPNRDYEGETKDA